VPALHRQAALRGRKRHGVLTAPSVDEPTPVRELNPEVPLPLAELIHQLLAKKKPATGRKRRPRW